MTWEELQISALQKIFEIESNMLIVDDSTAPYIAAMPGAANEAMLLLCTDARYFKKTGEIIQKQPEEQPEAPEEPEDTEQTKAKKEEIPEGTPEEGGATPPTFAAGKYNAYDLRQVFPDFYTLYDGYIMYTDGVVYERAEYETEGDSILLLPADKMGTWRVTYCAYPERITKETTKDTELTLAPEAASMVALYIAGQVYKEDDISLAQTYMNEFLEWLNRLKENAKKADSMGKNTKWKSRTGWW